MGQPMYYAPQPAMIMPIYYDAQRPPQPYAMRPPPMPRRVSKGA